MGMKEEMIARDIVFRAKLEAEDILRKANKEHRRVKGQLHSMRRAHMKLVTLYEKQEKDTLKKIDKLELKLHNLGEREIVFLKEANPLLTRNRSGMTKLVIDPLSTCDRSRMTKLEIDPRHFYIEE